MYRIFWYSNIKSNQFLRFDVFAKHIRIGKGASIKLKITILK